MHTRTRTHPHAHTHTHAHTHAHTRTHTRAHTHTRTHTRTRTHTHTHTHMHAHTHAHTPATNSTRPCLAHVDGGHLVSAHHAHIHPGLPGASSESFCWTVWPSIWKDTERQGCSRSVCGGLPSGHPLCSWNSHSSLCYISFITEIICFLLLLRFLSAWKGEWVPWVKEPRLPGCCIPHTCCFASKSSLSSGWWWRQYCCWWRWWQWQWLTLASKYQVPSHLTIPGH